MIHHAPAIRADRPEAGLYLPFQLAQFNLKSVFENHGLHGL
jgi:hypothetical protein